MASPLGLVTNTSWSCSLCWKWGSWEGLASLLPWFSHKGCGVAPNFWLPWMDTSQLQPYNRPFPSYTHWMHALCMVGPLDWTQSNSCKFSGTHHTDMPTVFLGGSEMYWDTPKSTIWWEILLLWWRALLFFIILWYRTSMLEGFSSRCMRLWECKNNIPRVIALCFLQGEWSLPHVVLVGIILI